MFDLLMSADMVLPDPDGMELTRQIKRHGKIQHHPKIIMLSSYSWGGIALLAVGILLHKARLKEDEAHFFASAGHTR